MRIVKKKLLYYLIPPYMILLLIFIYPLDILLSKTSFFASQPVLRYSSILIIMVLLIICVIYLVYESINAPLKHIIKFLDELENQDYFEENDSKEEVNDTASINEYDELFERIKKIKKSIKENMKKNIQKNMVSSIEIEKSHHDMKKAYEELKQLDVLKADFLANISHELRTPLISVEGYVEYLNTEKFGKLNEKQKKSITVSIDELKKLKKLINQLLLYSRLDAHLENPDFEPTNLEELAKNVLNEYVEAANKKNLKLNFFSQADLPQVMIDKEKIKTVLSNLIDNAIKFTETGEVRVILQKTEDGVRVSIYDTGVGVPNYYKNKLTDTFSQQDTSTSRKYGGVGLGLAIVKGLLDLHKIKINLESKENKGSIFYFTIKR